MAKKAEVEQTEYADAFAYLAALRSGELDISAVADFDFMPSGGADLIDKDEQLGLLENVPFFIMQMVFRPGFTREVAGQKLVGDYASLQIMIAPEVMLEKRGIDPASLPWPVMSPLVVNDGGTGMRRSSVAYLVARDIVRIREDVLNADLQGYGKLGESDYDIPVHFWHAFHAGDVRFDADGNTVYTYTPPKPILCARGVRKSEYQSDNGPAVTWYFG